MTKTAKNSSTTTKRNDYFHVSVQDFGQASTQTLESDRQGERTTIVRRRRHTEDQKGREKQSECQMSVILVYTEKHFAQEVLLPEVSTMKSERCQDRRTLILQASQSFLHPPEPRKRKAMPLETTFLSGEALRCVSVIRKAQFSLRVWTFLTITRESQGNIRKK